MQIPSPHSFHIPVMGISYTIDTPIKVACFGINSAISIIEDNLLEVMRKYYYQKNGEVFSPISIKEPDSRARRITDYLNLMDRMVQAKFEKLKTSAFSAGPDLAKYFELLPDGNGLRQKYLQWLASTQPKQKKALEGFLRNNMVPGTIEVNIMTKVDKDNLDKSGASILNGSDALTALKGYAESGLKNSGVIFSAGMNPRLYNYLESFTAFDATGWGCFHKRIIIKVSDYRSALIQGKYLAKKGIWVSEFRIESGLNCGGHVFATQGLLMGPILQEFKDRKVELSDSLFSLYQAALLAKGKPGFSKAHPLKISVQGGIGTYLEDRFLHQFYDVDSSGWGTPFLLCPEVTTVDDKTLQLLVRAKEEDIEIRSAASPLGVGFNYLKGTTAEKERFERIEKGRPGSPCTEKLLVSNTEFTKTPICTASLKYQKLKLAQLETLNLTEEEHHRQKQDVLSKECLCVGLSNSAPLEYEMPFLKKQKAVTICPGPNIVNFSKIATLREMTDHIYGRANLVQRPDRPNMFVAELRLYIDFLKEQIKQTLDPTHRNLKSWDEFSRNLLAGISYYRQILITPFLSNPRQMEKALGIGENEILALLEKIMHLISAKSNTADFNLATVQN